MVQQQDLLTTKTNECVLAREPLWRLHLVFQHVEIFTKLSVLPTQIHRPQLGLKPRQVLMTPRVPQLVSQLNDKTSMWFELTKSHIIGIFYSKPLKIFEYCIPMIVLGHNIDILFFKESSNPSELCSFINSAADCCRNNGGFVDAVFHNKKTNSWLDFWGPPLPPLREGGSQFWEKLGHDFWDWDFPWGKDWDFLSSGKISIFPRNFFWERLRFFLRERLRFTLKLRFWLFMSKVIIMTNHDGFIRHFSSKTKFWSGF